MAAPTAMLRWYRGDGCDTGRRTPGQDRADHGWRTIQAARTTSRGRRDATSAAASPSSVTDRSCLTEACREPTANDTRFAQCIVRLHERAGERTCGPDVAPCEPLCRRPWHTDSGSIIELATLACGSVTCWQLESAALDAGGDRRSTGDFLVSRLLDGADFSLNSTPSATTRHQDRHPAGLPPAGCLSCGDGLRGGADRAGLRTILILSLSVTCWS